PERNNAVTGGTEASGTAFQPAPGPKPERNTGTGKTWVIAQVFQPAPGPKPERNHRRADRHGGSGSVSTRSRAEAREKLPGGRDPAGQDPVSTRSRAEAREKLEYHHG